MNQSPFIILTAFVVVLVVAFLANLAVRFLFINYQREKKRIAEGLALRHRYEREAILSRLEIQEQTRQSIARDIHDNVNLSLMITNVNLQQINVEDTDDTRRRLADSIETLTTSISDLKDLSRSLTSDIISTNGLLNAIEEEIRQIKRLQLFTIDFVIEGETVFLDTETELIIFRIIQESFHNIISHSQSTHVWLGLNFTPSCLEVTIEDNGKGFRTADQQDTKGIGLKNMRSRVQSLGGTMNIENVPGQGVSIELVIPLANSI